MRKAIFFILIVASILLLMYFGCEDQQIFEETSLLIYIGIDPADQAMVTENTPLRFTFGLAGERDGDGELNLLEATDPLLSKAVELANSDTEYPIKDGKNQAIIINKLLAQQGLQSLTDIEKLHAVNRFLPSYIICDGDASELLRGLADKDIGDRSFIYLTNLLHNSGENALCPYDTRSGHILNMLNGRIDPMFPLVTSKGGVIAISGTALFRDDVMVGTLSTEQSRYLHFMNQEYDSSVIAIPFTGPKPLQHEISFFITDVSRTIDVSLENDSLAATFEVWIEGYVDELNWSMIIQQMDGEDFQAHIEQEIRHRMLGVLSKLQMLASDPLGVREIVRSRFPEYAASHDLREVYQNADFQIEVRVSMTNLSGL